MKTINKEVSDALHMLFHCSLKDVEYTTQREQFRQVYNYIEKLEKENKLLKTKVDKALDEIIKDKMEQFDDYVVYLLEKYEGMLKGNNKED